MINTIPIRQPATKIRKRGRAGDRLLRHRRMVREIGLVVALTFTLALFYVWSRVAVVQTGYHLHELHDEVSHLEDQYRALRLEIATRKSPRRLAPFAAKQLGLKAPTPEQIVVIPRSIRIAEQGH